ncbi:unnamed protein product [Danaus chrysippus]|uniref:(African queen) hypothetical protein n=1 Tax=Danaus chrysippus TaxID=151541 RepID=A0A8J2R042_9NEOP|nr:unnamed protein product [Danaus chrysippus]
MDNKSNICRVCLNTNIPNDSKSLFDKHDDLFLFEHINAITNINIRYYDGLPNKICPQCLQQLECAIVFKTKCVSSNEKLKKNCFPTELKLKSECFVFIKKEDIYQSDIKLEDECINEVFSPVICIEQTPKAEDSAKKVTSLPSCRKSRAIDLKLECHDCGETFKSKCKLSVHWKKTHMLTNLICTTCKRTFKSYKAYHMHKKRKSKSCVVAQDENVNIEGVGRTRKFVCKICNYITHRSKDLSAHLVTHSGDRPYKCDLCPKRFTQQSSLQNHKEQLHNNIFVEITCQFCGKYIKGRNKVYRHLKSHTDKRLPCTVCGKVVRGINFHLHMKRHSGVRPFVCEKCPSRFYTRAELCNHTRWVHSSKNKYYKCDICDYKSVRPHKVKSHMSRHTDINVACKICGRFFLSNERLALHEKTHFEDEKKYSCPHCDVKFFKRDSVRRHIKVKHVSEHSEDKKDEVKTELVATAVTDFKNKDEIRKVS